MSVIICKLIGGDEVLGTLVDSSDIQFTLSKPRVLQVMNGPAGPQAALMPWIMTAPDSTVAIEIAAIAASLTAPSDVEKSYLSHVTGLDLSASAGSKIVV